MHNVHFTFLGVPALRRGNQPIAYTRAKGLALLLYLAVARVAQPRDRLLDLLWPESLPQAARKNMRNTLWSIREALGDDVLDLDGNTIQLSALVTVDIYDLEDGILLLEGGRVEDLEAAAAHYHGPLADGLIVHEAADFEIWLTSERERIAATYLRLMDRIVALHGRAGSWQAVLDQAQRALVVEPLRETLHLAIVEAYLRLGQRLKATQQFAALTEILQRTLAVAPLPETVARYEALLAGTPHIPLPSGSRPVCPEPAAPLIGRQAELAVLDKERAIAAQSSARAVLISGDLGIGKSRLWQSWAAALPPETPLLATHALETDQPVPFGPLVSLFRQCGPAQAILKPPSALAPIWLAELSRLLPEIAALWPDLPPPLLLSPAEERPRLFQALTEALRLLASPLLVLAIDDLHWADPSTLDWLVYMLDQLHSTPLLLIGTYRRQDAREHLLSVIAGWQRQGRLHQVVLPQLTPDESAELLTALDAAEATRAHWVRQSGGNPYFLIELSRGADGAPSSDLISLIRTRLRTTVPGSAYQVLQAAAVLGDGSDLHLLHATSGRPEEDLLDALDALVGAAVLKEQSGAYQFAQPLVGAVVLQDLTAARRSFLHRRAAHALERANARPERVAERLMEHFAAAGETDRAAHYADLAAQRALTIGSFTEAAAYARQALDWLPTPQRRLLFGRVLSIAGGAGEARTQLEQAFADFERSGDAVGATWAGVMLAQMAIATSQPDLARDWLKRVPIERAQKIDPAVSVHARLLAASVDRLSQAFDDAEAQLDLVDQLLQEHELPFEASQSAFERGNVRANRGELQAAIPAYRESLRIAEASGSPPQQMLAHNNLAYHLLLLGDLDAAQQHIRAALALAERFELRMAWQYVYSTLGEIAFALGKLDDADAAFERALEAARSWHNAVQIANLRVNQALVARARNDLPRARALLDEAQTTFGAAVEPFVRDKILRYQAEWS